MYNLITNKKNVIFNKCMRIEIVVCKSFNPELNYVHEKCFLYSLKFRKLRKSFFICLVSIYVLWRAE